jgi:hypothetical protein
MALIFDVRRTCIYIICASVTRGSCDPDRGHVIIKAVMRKKKKSCPNYREFRIIEVSMCLVGVAYLVEVQKFSCKVRLNVVRTQNWNFI